MLTRRGLLSWLAAGLAAVGIGTRARAEPGAPVCDADGLVRWPDGSPVLLYRPSTDRHEPIRILRAGRL
jgi:hypothetical protein